MWGNWIWNDLPYHTEEVNVGIIHREINENCTSSPVQPQVILQVLQNDSTFIHVCLEILVITTTTVDCYFAPVWGTSKFFLGIVSPPEHRAIWWLTTENVQLHHSLSSNFQDFQMRSKKATIDALCNFDIFTAAISWSSRCRTFLDGSMNHSLIEWCSIISVPS